MAGLAEVEKEIEAGRVILITSAISRSEIFVADLTEDQRQQYRRLFQRDNHVEYTPHTKILDRASRLRHDSRTRPKGPVLTVPDSIHLATAMLLKVDEFHTWDGSARKQRGTPLLPLSGTALVEGLNICEPTVPPDPQPSLYD
jgi:predicted nucleic acid-binding protein